MKQKIIARLKEKFSGVNLSNTRLDAIADKLAPKITDETQIDAKLDELNEILPFTEIAKQDDRVRTLEAELKKPKPGPQPTPTPDPPKPADDGTPEWAKALIQQNQAMAQKIEQLESRTTAEKLNATLVGILKEKKVPESYYHVAITGRTFKDSEEVNNFANTLVESYTKYNQELVNEGLKQQPPPVMGKVTDHEKEVSPMMSEYLKSKEGEKKTA
jgi:hypothetical protein